MRPARARRALGLLPVLLLAAACGSTVQVHDRVALGDGLLAGQPSGQPLPGSAGSGRQQGGVVVPGGPGAGQVPGAVGPRPRGAVIASPGATRPGAATATRDRSPLVLGVLDVGDTSAFSASFGFSGGSGPSSQQVVRAMVAWYNAHGGIAGKRIELVEHTADAAATSYETEMSAACARFTQDHRAAVVMTHTGYQTSENYESCLTKAGVPDLFLGIGGYDETAHARHPLLFTPVAASTDASIRALLKGLTGTGFLTRSSRIGVLVEACPSNITAYQRTLVPLAEQLGLQVQRRDFDCVTGAGTMPQAISQVGAAALPFASAGVDRVVFVSNYQGAATAFFEQQAASQRYRPSYGLTSYAGAGPSGEQVSEDAQSRIKGVGWTPDMDVTNPGPATGARKRCWEALKSQDLDVGSSPAYLQADAVCAGFFLLEAALLRNGGRADAASLRPVLESASASPVPLGGQLLLSASRHHAGSLFAPFGYATGCGCMVYTGKPGRLAD